MPAIFMNRICIVIFMASWIPEAWSSEDKCQRHLEFIEAFMGKRLMNHVIRNANVMDLEFCGALCFMEHNCVSYNLMTTSETGKHNCELNNATQEEHEEDLEKNSNYEYHGAKNPCASAPCYNKATCQTGFTPKGYRCLCHAGFTGQNCKTETPKTMTPTTAECLLKTKRGQCCSIPFSYKGVTYHACTSADHDRLWCSLDAIYTGNWGNCA